VSRPPRVSYSAASGGISRSDVIQQVLNLSLFLENGQFILVLLEGYSGAIVSAILQTLQAFDDDRKRFLTTDISYNSTHDADGLYKQK